MDATNASSKNNAISGTSCAKAAMGPHTTKIANSPRSNVSVKPGLSLDGKFDKLLEAQLNFQNQMVQMLGNVNRTMTPRGPPRYTMN